ARARQVVGGEERLDTRGEAHAGDVDGNPDGAPLGVLARDDLRGGERAIDEAMPPVGEREPLERREHVPPRFADDAIAPRSVPAQRHRPLIIEPSPLPSVPHADDAREVTSPIIKANDRKRSVQGALALRAQKRREKPRETGQRCDRAEWCISLPPSPLSQLA